MKVLSSDTDMERFFQTLSQASVRLLALDYDGTLAPFVEDPARAVAYPGVMSRLQQLLDERATRLIFLTGRRIHDLMPLLELDPMPEIWGAHGYEHRAEGGGPIQLALGGDARDFLEQL
ncbi:MAG TPA: trehalose-phosphatase, partial [Acidiferrobacteraceae bacterium]|nr:trehalose-phosphatase [Acidiferrobacteraceae bacterium]